ncbi:hypothetical protein [Tenacibaculum crassostreae]|uniref:hypothetical protein n=1 Tax=Tenacibaculum crassostreae TaxID=502683 RepID=UPI003895856D
MKNLKLTLCIFALSAFFISCSSNDDEPTLPVDPNPNPTGKVTYNSNIKTLVDNSCATSSCHDAVNPTGGLPLTNYTQVKGAAETGNLFLFVNNNSMPPNSGGLSSTNKQLLEKWKNDGYLEN